MFDFFKRRVFNFKEEAQNTISQTQFILNTIGEFDMSEARKLMIQGENYYKNNNDIRHRKIYRFESDGSQVEDATKANNKISHSFMKSIVDEKVGYFLGQPPTITSKNLNLQELVVETLDEEFDDIMNDLAVESSNKGISWLHVYIDDFGEFKFMRIPSEQIIPLWGDLAHTKLDALIRYYFIEVYEGEERKTVQKIEYWTTNSVMYYVMSDEGLIPDIEANEVGEHVGHFSIDNEESGWGKIPYIPFKNNSYELPDIYFVKDIVDKYDLLSSDTMNQISEIQELIYVLKNYGGTDLAGFMKDLKYFKAIKVDDDGGVDVLKAEINVEASEKTLDRLKKDFYHFSQSVDMDTNQFGQNPSGVALEFLYSKLKLKVDNMERKFKRSFKELFYFMCEYYKISNQGIFDYKELKVTFTRSTITNVKEAIESANASVNLISKKTAMEHHPWIDDVEAEIQNLEDEAEDFNFGNFVPIDGGDTNTPNDGEKPITEE